MTKGKDNIPSWDGNPASWTEYRKAAYLYEETVKWENRYLCGPRLAAELSGAAKAAISNKKRGWLSREDGVEKLMKCLKEAMSEPALPEIANQLRAYFKVLRRRRGESMAAFCVRHREEYLLLYSGMFVFFAVFPSKLKKSIWMQNQFSILVYL